MFQYYAVRLDVWFLLDLKFLSMHFQVHEQIHKQFLVNHEFARNEQNSFNFGNRNMHRLCGWRWFGIFNFSLLQVWKEACRGGEEWSSENRDY